MLDQIETQYLLRLREDREEVKRTATEVGVMGEGDMRRRLDKDQVQFDAGADSLNCDSSFRSDYLLSPFGKCTKQWDESSARVAVLC